ncbi:hypothetical protein M758_5G044000 [Ceratodon purpureus]|nr:hypothetical protein M758_5G044000 [Ceratodon purpureus]
MNETILRDQARVTYIQKHITHMVSRAMARSGPHGHHREEKSFPAQDVETPLFSALTFGTGEYFAIVGVGTPHRYIYLLMDTGSDITWLQCAPCKNCYKQKNTLFNPSDSSTFKVLDCHADLCLNLDVMGCMSNRCLYQADYGDGSFTMGELATDNVALDAATGRGQVVLSNIPLGCGHDNEGEFGSAAGILGLGKGPLSFPNHIDSSSSMPRASVFSYCLPDREGDSNQRSSLIFGNAALADHAADGVIKFTPQLQNPHVATYYYLQITGISVGGNLLTTIPPSAFQLDFHGNGGTIIDSGTTVTRLLAMAYSTVRDAFRHATDHLEFVGEWGPFDTCYDLGDQSSIKVPTITFHFLGDADMRLPPSNYLVPVDNDNTYCFAFIASELGPSIIGNVQQQEFRIIYDNVHQRIGFYPSHCTS